MVTFARVAVITALVIAAGPVSAGIGIFSDPSGSNCNLTLPPLSPAPVYVLYVGKGGPLANGAEFRIDGMPGVYWVDFIVLTTPAPGSLNFGNAFDGTGQNVAWPTVQPFDANGNLLLAAYTLVSLVPVPTGTILKVICRRSPGYACGSDYYPCALITDASFNLICQLGGEMHVNGGPTCTVAVEQRTWTDVRNLYR